MVAPPYYYKTKVLTSSVKEYAGIAYLAAVLRKQGHNVEILDADLCGYDVEQTVKAVLERSAGLIGFTVLQVAAHAALEIVKELREAGLNSHITLGGHFPTFALREIYNECKQIDSIVLGEGEHTLLELAEALSEGRDWKHIAGLAYREDDRVIINPPRRLIADLDALPFQARDTLSEVMQRGGFASVITSRGCYGNCSFCSVNAFYSKAAGSKWRSRSPEHVGEELEWLVDKWGVEVFVFNDDNFIGPGKLGKERAYRIGEEILKRGLNIKFAIPASVNDVDKELFGFLKIAGLRSVFLGIESMVQEDLDLLNKHTTVEQNEEAIRVLEELGIFYQIGFIMFYPSTRLEEVKHNISYIKDKILMNNYCGTQVFTGDLRILQGTVLEESFKNSDFVKKERFHYTYKVQDWRVEELRFLMDHLILKKTFPLLVECKEEFMTSSWRRWIRTLTCELQLSMALKVIENLENGGVSPEHMKMLIRDLDKGLNEIRNGIAHLKDKRPDDFVPVEKNLALLG